jgi:hypothetical protein
VERDAQRRYRAKAWYLAPPLDTPDKAKLRDTAEMVMEQQTPDVELATIEPFLRELGWEPA